MSSAVADTPAKLTVLHTFELSDGAFPAAELLEVADGVFYGSTSAGGPKEGGTIFRIAASGEFSTLFEFGRDTTAFEGSAPNTALIRATDGFLYGTTSLGGDLGGGIAGGYGTVFRLTQSGTLTTLHTFTGPDGAQPFGTLLQASDGFIYGTTIGGGPNGQGTLFRMTPAAARCSSSRSTGQLTTLHYFDNGEGAGPVVFGSDGALYGITHFSQQVYRITTAGTFVAFVRRH